MAQDPPFKISPELHELAERNVEQARAAYGLFMDFLTQAKDASSKAPPNAIMPGFIPIQKRAIEIAQENGERFFALAADLAQANNLQSVLALESLYVQAQLQACAFQAQELGRLMANAIPAFSRTIAIP
jgi:hypothetical protein